MRDIEQANPGDITAAYREVQKIARQAAGNFIHAFRLLPSEQRNGIEALYAFCRAGDDAVDDSDKTSRTRRLESLRSGLDMALSGKYIDSTTLTLADAHRRFNFDRRHFEDLFLGLESDLTVRRYSTFDELRLYCYRVASTVGLLCLSIFGCDTVQARIYAENLGIAMQLTNILRDIAEDYRRGRIYLPESDLVKFGLSNNHLLESGNQSRLKELVLYEVKRAEGFFNEARMTLPEECRNELAVARIMGSIYMEILSRIRKADRHDKRISLSASTKIAIAARVIGDAHTG